MNTKKTYQEMILLLRESEHKAPDMWDAIEEDLSFNEQVSGLKNYKVKKDLWSGIEAALDEGPATKIPSRSKKILTIMIVLLVLSAGLIYTILKKHAAETVEYSSEIIYAENMVLENTEDEVFEEANSFIKEYGFLFENSKLQEYNSQLADIDNAIKEIKAMQEQYGVDENSIKLLSKMEREKADLIKSMINRT
jgi:hypothetical protein